MTIAFISDLHLTPDRPELAQLFIAFINKSAGMFDQLYILGDLFEYWVGDDASAELGQQVFESVLKQLTNTGTPVYLLRGNRDFLLGEEFAQRTGCHLICDPKVINLGDKRTLLTHGDALCVNDTEHQLWRHQSKSAKWQQKFLKQSIRQRTELAQKLRSESKHNKQNKFATIMDVNQQTVEALMQKYQVDLLIHGHTHKQAMHEFELAGKLAHRYVLGEWNTRCSALYYTHGQFAWQINGDSPIQY